MRIVTTSPGQESPPKMGDELQNNNMEDIERSGYESNVPQVPVQAVPMTTVVPQPPLKPVLPQVSPQPQTNRTKYWLMALAVLLVVIAAAVVCGILFLNDDDDDEPEPAKSNGNDPYPDPNPNPGTTPPTTPQEHYYSLSDKWMVNRTEGDYYRSSEFAGGPKDARIGVTETFFAPWIYDTSELGDFRVAEEGYDTDTIDMIVLFNITILSVDEWNEKVEMKTEMYVFLFDEDFAEYTLGADQLCEKDWRYSVTLDSTATHYLPTYATCDLGTAGIWEFQVSANVESLP